MSDDDRTRVVVFDLKKNVLTGYTTTSTSVPHNGDMAHLGEKTVEVLRVVPITHREIPVVELHGVMNND